MTTSKSIWRTYTVTELVTVKLIAPPGANLGPFGAASSPTEIQVAHTVEKRAFNPQFLDVTVTTVGHLPMSANNDYFATPETAVEVLNRLNDKYGDGKAYLELRNVSQPFMTYSELQYWIVFPEKKDADVKLARPRREYIVGLIAAYWKQDRNPEDQFPGVANKLVEMNFFTEPV